MTNKRTLAICDRCGLEYRLHTLRKQVTARKATSVLVCRSCLDEDQPQWFGPRNTRSDPRPVPNARPDIMESEIFAGFGWNPVGGMGAWMQTGATYDFDLEDRLVESNSCFDFIAQEDSFAIIQEGGNIIETEMSCLYVLMTEQADLLVSELGLELVTQE